MQLPVFHPSQGGTHDYGDLLQFLIEVFKLRHLDGVCSPYLFPSVGNKILQILQNRLIPDGLSD